MAIIKTGIYHPISVKKRIQLLMTRHIIAGIRTQPALAADHTVLQIDHPVCPPRSLHIVSDDNNALALLVHLAQGI